MADKVNHNWVVDLDLSRIGFGTGDRMIVRDWTFNRKYRITVPREYE